MAKVNRRGVTHIKPNESQGRANSPRISKQKTGSGFAWGIDQVAKASKSSSPLPKNVPNSAGIKVRPGVWHPNASKP